MGAAPKCTNKLEHILHAVAMGATLFTMELFQSTRESCGKAQKQLEARGTLLFTWGQRYFGAM